MSYQASNDTHAHVAEECQRIQSMDLHIYVKNCCISSNLRIAKLLAELQDIEWDIIFISESRAESGKFILDDEHILFCELQDYAASECAIFVHVKWRDAIRKIILRRLGRLIAIDIKFGFRIYRCIAFYMPHAGYDLELVE